MDDVRVSAAAKVLQAIEAASHGCEYPLPEFLEDAEAMLKAADAVDPLRNPRVIETVEDLDAAIIRSFEQGESLVLLDGWRPWVIWENDQGDIRVSSLPVEDDPDSLSLSDISLPATVLHEPRP